MMQQISFSSTILSFRGTAGVLFGILTCLVATMFVRPNLFLLVLCIGVAARIAKVSHPRDFALFAAMLGILPGMVRGVNNYYLVAYLQQAPMLEYLLSAIAGGILYAGFFALLGFFMAKILNFVNTRSFIT